MNLNYLEVKENLTGTETLSSLPKTLLSKPTAFEARELHSLSNSGYADDFLSEADTTFPNLSTLKTMTHSPSWFNFLALSGYCFFEDKKANRELKAFL